MLEPKLLTWKYYKNKLPLYLQNSYGFEEHFKLLFDVLINTNEVDDAIFREINLFRENYFSTLDIDGITANGTEYNILDWFASLYNVSRKFSLEGVVDPLELTNYELLILIMVKIVSTYYDGSYEDIKYLYDLIGINVEFYTNSIQSGKAYCFLTNAVNYSQNIQDMFNAGLLIIQSAGIEYKFGVDADLIYLGIWDSNDVNKEWDSAKWD